MSDSSSIYLVDDTTIKFNGSKYEPGDEIELTKEQAVKFRVTLKTAMPADVPTDPAERIKAIKVAIASLKKENPHHYTAAGVPSVPALAKILGWPLKGEERDQAYSEINPVKVDKASFLDEISKVTSVPSMKDIEDRLLSSDLDKADFDEVADSISDRKKELEAS